MFNNRWLHLENLNTFFAVVFEYLIVALNELSKCFFIDDSIGCVVILLEALAEHFLKLDYLLFCEVRYLG
jgi:hypothetical protein